VILLETAMTVKEVRPRSGYSVGLLKKDRYGKPG
jgi:hypothetical protein